MYSLRIFSITASLVTFAIAMAAVLLALHYKWHQVKQTINFYHSSFWKTILDPGFTFIITAGLSMSLLACSIIWNEKWVEILLFLFVRFLLMKQALFLWRFLPGLRPSGDADKSLIFFPGLSLSANTVKTIIKYLRWIVICISGSLFGLSVFIVVQVARTQHHDPMLKCGLISFAGEFLELSILYAWLVWYNWRLRPYQLTSAFGAAVLGCLSAFILFFLKPGHRISWVLVLWIHFGTAVLWLVRSIVIGVRSFQVRENAPSDRGIAHEVQLQSRNRGFNKLEDGTNHRAVIPSV